MDRTIKIVAGLFAVVIIGTALLFFSSAQTTPTISGTPGSGNVTVYFFYGQECPHCHAVMPLIKNLTQKYPQVTFRYLETWHHPENQTLADTMNGQLGVKDAGVPEVIVGTTVLIGDQDIPAKLEALIQSELKKKQ